MLRSTLRLAVGLAAILLAPLVFALLPVVALHNLGAELLRKEEPGP